MPTPTFVQVASAKRAYKLAKRAQEDDPTKDDHELQVLRKRSKRIARYYRDAKLAKAEAKQEIKVAPEPAAPVKKVRKARAPRPRTEKELANDARMKARIARAKEIQAAADPKIKWCEAIKQASAEMRAQPEKEPEIIAA